MPAHPAQGRELGLTGWVCYVAGRAGALGEVRPDTVVAALGLIAPEAVRDGWEAASRTLAPSEVAAKMLVECCRWGTEQLDDAPRVTRMAALAESAVVAADAAGMPLFAAWRALQVPVDGPGARAAIALHLLRRRAWADAVADRLCGQAFEVLLRADRAELAALLQSTLAHTKLTAPDIRPAMR